MALRFMDGFDHYEGDNSSSTYALIKWTGNLGVSGVWSANGVTGFNIGPSHARSGGGNGLACQGSGGNNQAILYKTLSGSAIVSPASITVGFAYQAPTSLPNANCWVIALMDGTSEQISVRGDGAGHLTIQRGATVLATSTNTLSAGVWFYIELQAVIHNTTGTYELKVNGTDWIAQATGQNTRSTANNQATGIALGIGTTVASTFAQLWDDIYVLDSSGSVNNTFLGPCQVQALRPAQAGNYSQWTPNYGVNNQNVADAINPDGDTSFNESSTAGQIDTFRFQNILPSAGSVFGIQHVITVKQDAGAQRTICPLQRSSATDYAGTNFNPSAGSYTMDMECHDTNPDTSAAWTVAGVNNAEFGYKLVS